MSSLFGGGGGGGGNNIMQSLQSLAMPTLPKPRVTRMPTETDPAMLEAAKRTRRAAMERKGRLSTIMTDQVGSSGTALGA